MVLVLYSFNLLYLSGMEQLRGAFGGCFLGGREAVMTTIFSYKVLWPKVLTASSEAMITIMESLSVIIGTFRSEYEYDYEYEFSVLSTRIRFRGRHFSKCACSERKTRTRSRTRTPI